MSKWVIGMFDMNKITFTHLKQGMGLVISTALPAHLKLQHGGMIPELMLVLSYMDIN